MVPPSTYFVENHLLLGYAGDAARQALDEHHGLDGDKPQQVQHPAPAAGPGLDWRSSLRGLLKLLEIYLAVENEHCINLSVLFCVFHCHLHYHLHLHCFPQLSVN